jgi:hypothetical protein
MNMRVVGERRSPGVEDGREADPGAEVLRAAAIIRSVSAAVRNSRSYTTALFWNAIAAIGAGRVKTTW